MSCIGYLHEVWYLWRANGIGWCVEMLLADKIQTLTDVGALGWLPNHVAQEERDNLNLFGCHCVYVVGKIVLEHELKERSGDGIRSRCWHQTVLSHRVSMLQLLRSDRFEVLGRVFHGVAQYVVSGDFVSEDRIGLQSSC